ncbi:Sel1-like protein [Xylogone sp. PMI_703]|nr:Sel1-like protein [Xylogone sp. PMI_703]
MESPPRKAVPQQTVPARSDSLPLENTNSNHSQPLPRKQLRIPIPADGRMNGGPVSPVRVNVQPDNWPPAASSAAIEGENEVFSPTMVTSPMSYDNGPSGQRQNQQSPTPRSASYDMSYRSRDQMSRPEPIQRPEPVVVPNGDGMTSRSPPVRYSPPLSAGLPGRLDGVDNPEEPHVPQLQYHHQSHFSEGGAIRGSRRATASPTEFTEAGTGINRHLTPNQQYPRGTPAPRPISAYSDMSPRGRSPSGYSPSPHNRAPSAHSRASYDSRPLSYVDLANLSYPQQAAPQAMSFDNAQLRSIVGNNASLLTAQKTLEMYRQNVKKTNDPETQYAFALFLVQAAQEAGQSHTPDESESPRGESGGSSGAELLREAKGILQRLSDKGYPFAQYYLADGYASGLFSKGKEDYNTAFPLFVAASKHGHAESGYRAALCYEFGWGCRKDPAKAVQFYRQSASKNHPGAMTRLGRACLAGDLGLGTRYREGVKWLKRATESADPQYNQAPYHLGLLYETGYGDDIFQDESYAAQLFTQAADLGHAEASYRLGDAYEHGKLSCPRDPALSVHFYTGAAQRGHPAAMMALCAWYLVGAEPVLEKDENEAYEWARQAAEMGLTKAEYAVGYFTEMGIGCRRDPLEANVWYVKAADAGDERAKHRLAAIRAAASGGKPMEVAPPRKGKKGDDKECVIM